MAERAISLEEQAPPLDVGIGPTGLEEQLAHEREEVLRLRDLLIAKDRELGAALGRAAELEAEPRRMLRPKALLRRLTPRMFWPLLAKLRR